MTNAKPIDFFLKNITQRRSVRTFQTKPVSKSLLKKCIKAAASSPSGANLQPWHFVLITNPDVKHEIKKEAEKLEQKFYHQNAPKEWLNDLAPLHLNAEKPFLETAPCLIVVFMQRSGIKPDGSRQKHYYPLESIGIATGILLSSLQMAGLSSLVYTPPKRQFLNRILKRPNTEKAFAIIVVGYAGKGPLPNIDKKSTTEIMTWLE